MVTVYVTDNPIDSTLMPGKSKKAEEPVEPLSVVVPEWWIRALELAMEEIRSGADRARPVVVDLAIDSGDSVSD